MTAHTLIRPQRRGACPGLSAPMATGDGLLVRLMPIGTVPLAAFAGLCKAVRQHGNGVIEVTARGSIQVRGLNAASAPKFAEAVAALGIAAADGIPILSNALAGLDPEELLDAGALASDLRSALVQEPLAAAAGAKVSVAIDGGGATSLDGLAADLRLRAEAVDGGAMLRVGVGGDGDGAAQLGVVAAEDGVAAAIRLLEFISRRGRDARARDILAAEGEEIFRLAIADLLRGDTPPRRVRGRRDAIGLHRLRDGLFAGGIGIAFGHADAAALERLIEAAGDAQASGVRTVAGRTLMIVGLTKQGSSTFVAAAERMGFIVRAGDPRRHVVACAGAPICASALLASRAIAPMIAETTAPLIDGSFTIHLSGCAKGCAHPAAAALTIVGTAGACALIADGSARDAPFAVVAADELPAAVADAMASRARNAKHGTRHG